MKKYYVLQSVTPPFVPLGTGLKEVIRNGWLPKTVPNSDAHVSPFEQANTPKMKGLNYCQFKL